jgi:phage tail sheath protein FI
MASEPFDFASGQPELRADAEEVIPIVATTVAAFVGRAERGPLNEPIVVSSYDDYRRVFGGHCAFSFVSFAVQHFFQHGGENAVVVRVANRAARALLEVPAGAEVLRLQARQPGSREYLRVSVDYDRVESTFDKFNLIVQRLGRPSSQLVDDQEVFEALSMDPADERYVVDALQASELVRLVAPLPAARPDATRPPRPGEPIPYLAASPNGTDGEELTDYDIIGSNSEGTGMFALDRCEQIDFVCIPSPPGRDLGSTSFVAATRYCERRGALLVWDPPWSWSSSTAAVFGVRSSGYASEHAVTYFPRVVPRSDLGRFGAGMPACGVVAGVLARCDRAGVWHEMPFDECLLRANLQPLVEIGESEAAILNGLGVNVFKRKHPGGSALHGDVTFAGATAIDTLAQRLSVSRLTSFLLRAIEHHTRWVFTAQCADEIAADLERQVWIFLMRLKQRSALAGQHPEQSFFVRAVASEPTESSAVGDVTVILRVGFAPRRPNEFLVYDFRYHERAMRTEVVPVLDAERNLG